MINCNSSTKMERYTNKATRQIKLLKIHKAITLQDLLKHLLKFQTFQIIIFISQ